MLRNADNPPMICPRVQSVREMDGKWWVAHTRARAEKAFAWDLLQLGANYFLPLVEQTRFSGGKKRRGRYPLFPGYVFFRGDEETRYQAMTTDKLCQTIPVMDEESLTEQLWAIERALENGFTLERQTSTLVGHYCRVRSGPLKGLEGRVLQTFPGRARVLLEVSMIGEGGILEIEPELLDRLDEEPVARDAPRGGVG